MSLSAYICCTYYWTKPTSFFKKSLYLQLSGKFTAEIVLWRWPRFLLLYIFISLSIPPLTQYDASAQYVHFLGVSTIINISEIRVTSVQWLQIGRVAGSAVASSTPTFYNFEVVGLAPSQPVWTDGYLINSIFCHLNACKFAQKYKIFVKVGSEFCQILRSYLKKAKHFLKAWLSVRNFAKSGHTAPNPIAGVFQIWVMHGLFWFYFRSFHITIQLLIEKREAWMLRLGFEPGAAGWWAQMEIFMWYKPYLNSVFLIHIWPVQLTSYYLVL